MYKYPEIVTMITSSGRLERRTSAGHCWFHKTKMDFQDHFKEESQTKLNKKVEFKKSMSLPDFSMNVTYILKWLSRLRRQETYEGELGLRKINKNYYSEYSLNEISKNIKKRHSDPWILKHSFNNCKESEHWFLKFQNRKLKSIFCISCILLWIWRNDIHLR